MLPAGNRKLRRVPGRGRKFETLHTGQKSAGAKFFDCFLFIIARHKDRSTPDKIFAFYEVFSAPTAFDTFLLRSMLNCASQRPEDAPETANTLNKKEITMDFKKLYFTLFNTLSDAVEHINTHDYEEARLLLIHAQQEAEECYIAGAANS